ncbi:MAG: hypothetical protein KDD73_00015 [Anaerolineales bacterium]|nr:hypothetical protein [Anaerolineales bacterium]
MNRPRPCPKIALSTMLLAAMLLMGCESLPLWPDQRIVPGGVGEVAVTVVENPPRVIRSPCTPPTRTLSVRAVMGEDRRVHIEGDGFEPNDEPTFRMGGKTANGSWENEAFPASFVIGIDGHFEYEMGRIPPEALLDEIEVAVSHSGGTTCVPLQVEEP